MFLRRLRRNVGSKHLLVALGVLHTQMQRPLIPARYAIRMFNVHDALGKIATILLRFSITQKF